MNSVMRNLGVFRTFSSLLSIFILEAVFMFTPFYLCTTEVISRDLLSGKHPAVLDREPQ